ncbi:MAG: ABC transporter permease, partial [Anaerolinea sp.]|nr:ABC transporter permease [Anaerolinea sp.]
MSVTVKRAGNRGYWRASWRKLRRNPLTMFALLLFMGLTLASVFAPLIAPYDPLKQNYT